MQWFDEWWVAWVLVAVGGAAGSVFTLLILRCPTPNRLLLSTAGVCGVFGVVSACPDLPVLTPAVTFGILGTALSMLLVVAGTTSARPGTDPITRTLVAVTRKLAGLCVIGVTCALAGYLVVRAGTTMHLKLQ